MVLSHHIRVDTHWTIWFSGWRLKKNSGVTLLELSKQEESEDAVTSAATLVPPEPNPVASLTYGEMMSARGAGAGMRCRDEVE